MPQFPSHIFGMHDQGAEQLFANANKKGWGVVSVKVNPPDHNGDFTSLSNAGFGVIVRLNNGYNSEGTIPNSTQYAQFAQQCAGFVAGSQGANIWIIGNETNSGWERPGNNQGMGGEAITPSLYAQCFAKCSQAIKQVASHKDDWLVPSAPAPWNPSTTYAGNLSGDWVKYFQDTLTQCIQLNAKPDALAIHTYTHGMKPNLITSEEMEGNPTFSTRRHHFRAYRDFLSVVPASLKTAPVFITETQSVDPDWWKNQNIGWIQAAYKEINDWNAIQTNQPIQAVCLFRWEAGNPDWSISDKNGLKDDFKLALQKDYKVRWATTTPPQPDPLPTAAISSAIAHKPWMPINTGASLYQFAQLNNLGYPQTDEFKFTFNNAIYICQVYNGGIVYVKEGDWGNCKWVAKPAGA